jgi:hypothetical protein
MSVIDQTPYSQAVGNGVTTIFPFAFLVLAKGDISVYLDSVLKVVDVDYTVSGTGIVTGGSVTFLVAPANAVVVSMVRTMARTRSTDYQNLGDFNADVVDADFDRAILLAQDLNAQFARTLRVANSEFPNIPALPPVSSRASKLLAFDTAGNPEVVASIGVTTLSRSVIGGFLYPQTVAEVAASVTPTDYAYPAGTVSRYGGVGDGVTDDTQALIKMWAQAAQVGGASCFIPAGTWKYTSSLGTIPNILTSGEGRNATKLDKQFNGDAATLGEGAAFQDLYWEGNGATRTGRGLLCAGTAGRQSLTRCKAVDFDGYCLEFETNAGSQSSFQDSIISRYNSDDNGRYATKIADAQQLLARPRKFVNCESNGLDFIDFGGSNNTLVTNCYFGGVQYTAESRAVAVVGGRCRQVRSLTLDGSNNTWQASDVGPQLILAPTLLSCVVGPFSMNAGLATNHTITAITQAASAVVTISTAGSANPFIVSNVLHIDSVVGMVEINDLEGTVTAIGGSSGAWTITLNINSSGFTAYTSGGFLSKPAIIDNTAGNNANQIFQGRQIYNPTVSNSGGNYVAGNAACLGYYAQAGSLVTVWINYTMGSTTTIGTTELRFRLPKPKPDGEVLSMGGGDMQIGAQRFIVSAQIPGNVAYVRLLWSRNDNANSGVVAGNSPVAMAAGDLIRFSFSYER